MHTLAERQTSISLSPPSTPRLYLAAPRPQGSPRTSLDGGWWPRSTDPVAELPGLILALQTHGPADHRRRVSHVMLRMADWDSHPRRLRIDGPADSRVVRLSWFDTLPAGLLTAIHADGHRTDLLTVPPTTPHAAAWAGLEMAAHATNHLHTPELLTAITAASASPASPQVPARTEDTSLSAWESEGGRVRQSRPTSGPTA